MSTSPAALPVASRPGLIRALGPWMATAVVVGTVIGSGVFRKPHDIAKSIPFVGLVALAWVLGGVLAFMGSLAYAEVAVKYPRAGGNYVFLKEGYGRLAGFLWGWVEFSIIRGASLAALATAFTDSLHDILRQAGLPLADYLGFWELNGLTVALILFLALLNVRGVRWGGMFQLLITTIKVGSLVAILLLPFLVPLLRAAGGEPAAPRLENLRPLWPESGGWTLVTAFGAGMVGCLWAYHGWMNVAWVAEEVKAPQRNLPLALFGGVGLVMFLYLGANLAYCLILPQSQLAEEKSAVVATVFAEALLGPTGVMLASAAIMCSVLGALSGNLLTGPRLLYAMGEDGLAPRALGAAHPRFHTPARAILSMAAWACLLVLAVAALVDRLGLPPRAPFDVLSDLAIFGAVPFETLAVSTIFVFRRRGRQSEQAFRCPGYPVVPVIYIGVMALVFVSMFFEKMGVTLAGLGIVTAGLGVYWLVLRRGGTRNQAPPGQP
jgi:amino acid transporter